MWLLNKPVITNGKVVFLRVNKLSNNTKHRLRNPNLTSQSSAAVTGEEGSSVTQTDTRTDAGRKLRAMETRRHGSLQGRDTV